MPFFTDSPYASLDRLRLQRKYLWNVLLPLPVSLGLKMPLNMSIPEPGLVSANAIAVEFGLPSATEIISMDWGNRKSKMSGKIDVEEIQIRLLEVEYSFVFLYFRWWWSQIMTKKAVYNPPTKYKKDILVIMLNTDLQPNAIYRCEGCFPKGLPKYSLDYASNDPLIVDVTISCDTVDLLV